MILVSSKFASNETLMEAIQKFVEEGDGVLSNCEIVVLKVLFGSSNSK